jgi:hypothetical protein
MRGILPHQMSRSAQLTLRGLGPELQRELRNLARRERTSLNRAALRLLERGAGIGRREADQIGSSLDHLIGTWTRHQADAFLDSIRSCEQIDEELWK